MQEQTDSTQPTNQVKNQVAPNQPKKEGSGPLFGIIIIVIIIILGGLYFWGDQLNKQEARDVENALIDSTVNDGIATPQDDPTAIEADLDQFDLQGFEDKLNADLKSIEAGL